MTHGIRTTPEQHSPPTTKADSLLDAWLASADEVHAEMHRTRANANARCDARMSVSPLPESYAAQILRVTAAVLDLYPNDDINRATNNAAFDVAVDAIAGHLPEAVRDIATWNAKAAMPAADGPGTCHWFADRLRATAEHIG